MADQTLKIFKALGNKTRMQIVRDFLSGHEAICTEVKERLSKSQPTLSHHINKLVDAEVLIEHKKGVNCYYRVNDEYLRGLGIDVKKLAKEDSYE